MNEEPAAHHDSSDDISRAIHEFSITDFGKTLFHHIQRDNVTGLASEVAYNMIFAIPSLLIFLVTLTSILQNTTGINVTDSLHRVIANHAPGSAQPLLDELVTNAITQANTGAVTIRAVVAFAVAMWGASGGMGALVDAISGAFEVIDHRKFIRKEAMILGLTVVTGVLVIAAFVLPVFAEPIAAWLARELGLGSEFTVAWRIGS